MSADLNAIRRQLKIKTGAVRRGIKELDAYKKEEQESVQSLEKAKASGADGADIRKYEAILRESQKMVPDAQERLRRAVEDLRDLLTSASSITELADDEDVLSAKSAIAEADT